MVTGGPRWLCSCTQRHARQPELLAWIPELDTLSTQILWWWPKPNHWRPNLLLVSRVELLPIRSNCWWPISASCRAHGEQNEFKVPIFQIVVQVIDINSRYTKSHSCVKKVLLLPRCRFLGVQKDWVGSPLFLAAK